MKLDVFKKIVDESKSFSEVSKKIYGNCYCGNRQTIKKRIIEHSINISHFNFKPNGNDFKNRFNKTPLNEILISGSTYTSSNHLKDRLYDENLKERKCELCGQDENWNNMKISLILDHVNGINNDNRIENLRIVCPNCNAGLSTHGGKNITHKSTKRCNKKTISQRKVKRPPYEQLKKEIEETSYCAVGRKYGVSDNAIRKWIKFYEKNNGGVV